MQQIKDQRKTSITEIIQTQKEKLQNLLTNEELAHGEIIFNNGGCQILSQSPVCFELIAGKDIVEDSIEYKLQIQEDGHIIPLVKQKSTDWDRWSYACLLQIDNEIHLLDFRKHEEHKQYTREGMIKRVLSERWEKARKAGYKIEWADNIYGDHILTNERGIRYKIFLRDFENETGYSDSVDARINKLGTTKHIMFAFESLKEDRNLYKKLSKICPFVEIYCDPLNDYKITWHYPHEMPISEKLLISRYFKNSNYIDDSEITGFLHFLIEAEQNENFNIRPEVREKVANEFDRRLLEDLKNNHNPDYKKIYTKLYDFQKEGIEFALYKKNAIIADEMGLGKTIQAIGTAILKKDLFNFNKTLVVCPASLKEQWKREVEKFSGEKALVIQGTPAERAQQYSEKDHYFHIVNYETILRDHRAMNRAGFDFLILDEAQRAKNFETKTASSLKRLNAKHKLVITGTPIENKLIDIFSIMGILDPSFFGPLWEFSYQHCLFDPHKYNKINGYYNLDKLNKKLESVLIRREKRKVIDQLPHIQQIDVPVHLSELQSEYHSAYARGLTKIVYKKYLTPYDLQLLQLLLAKMRMVCNSTYLVDEETNESPKLEELKNILLDQFDLANSDRKIIIFSEWVKMHKLIGRMLRENHIGFVELNGKIPVKSRGELIRKFENNKQYKVFLSTEAGGSGLNLQVANTVINFELPWNPAKKNQRIGRIDRLGQKSQKLTVINFISRFSIEERIASGLLVKQSLFDSVLSDATSSEIVDFSSRGRSQFINQLQEFISESEEVQIKLAGETQEPEEKMIETLVQTNELDLSEDNLEDNTESTIEESNGENKKQTVNPKEIETVMNSGMQFLAGLYKMSTGKDMDMKGQKIEVDEETGEVVMRFKIN